MRSRSMGELRTARNCDAAPHSVSDPITSDPQDISPARQNLSARMNTIPSKLGSPSKRPRVNSVPPMASRATLASARKASLSQPRVGEPSQDLSKFRASFRRRRPDAPLFDDHRR